MFTSLSLRICTCAVLIAVCAPFEGIAATATSNLKNPISAKLVCVETTTNTGEVPAHSSIAIQAPACEGGATIVSGGCASSNPTALYINEIDTNQFGFGCEFVSSSDNTETVSAYGRCCHVDLKIQLP